MLENIVSPCVECGHITTTIFKYKNVVYQYCSKCKRTHEVSLIAIPYHY